MVSVRDTVDVFVGEWARARPDLDVSATHILQRVSRIHLIQSASAARALERFGISLGEFEVMVALERAAPNRRLKPGELGDQLMLSSGAVTNRIDRLEAAGLAERHPDPEDRRATLVALTRSGRRLLKQALPVQLTEQAHLISALSPAQRRQLTALLRRLLSSAPFTQTGYGDQPPTAPPGPPPEATRGRASRR